MKAGQEPAIILKSVSPAAGVSVVGAGVIYADWSPTKAVKSAVDPQQEPESLALPEIKAASLAKTFYPSI